MIGRDDAILAAKDFGSGVATTFTPPLRYGIRWVTI